MSSKYTSFRFNQPSGRSDSLISMHLEGPVEKFLLSSVVLKERVERVIEESASFGVDKIRQAYLDPKGPPLHPMTMFINRTIRGSSSGIPLNQTSALANSVEYIRNFDTSCTIRINPYEVTDGNVPFPYYKIASMQEYGYQITVTEKIRRFWYVYAKLSNDPSIVPRLTASTLHVPARPVWGPCEDHIAKYFAERVEQEINRVLIQNNFKPITPDERRLSASAKSRASINFKGTGLKKGIGRAENSFNNLNRISRGKKSIFGTFNKLKKIFKRKR